MAENKNSFVLYAEYLEIFEELNDEDAGQLAKHLFRYVNDKDPKSENPMVKLAFIPIKQALKRDLKKWETYQKKQSENGKKGGRPPKAKETQPFNIKPKKADNVNVNDNVNDNVNTDDDVYKNINTLYEKYIANDNLLKAVLQSNDFSNEGHLKKRLQEFNNYLKAVDQNLKTWKDYTSHFLNWHKKNGKTVSKSPTDVTL